MLTARKLDRNFIFKDGKQDIVLTDPDPGWNPEAVLNFYSANYPILTTSKITGPEINDDKMVYKFESVIGTKG